MAATIWAVLIWGGAAVTLLGVAGLAWCVRLSLKAKGAEPAQAKAIMQKVVVYNLGSMAVAVFGLLSMVTGLILR